MTAPAKPQRVALFGGTFDPIHAGHLAAAHQVLDLGLVDEVIFIPAGDPPHKRLRTVATAEERHLMAVLATVKEPRFRVARWELEREGPSYTIETVIQAQKELGGAELFWLIGADAAATLHTWHQAERLVTLTRFLVVSREGVDETELQASLARRFPGCPANVVRRVHMPVVALSSTDVRAACARGQAPAGVPSCVAAYIVRYGLYREPVRNER